MRRTLPHARCVASTRTASLAGAFGRAFTLTELLIVIGIITTVLVLAVPAFNFITGARSQEAAKNVISAMLTNARLAAINQRQQTGVFFYFDPVTERTTLCLVTREALATDDPDVYDQYKVWQAGTKDNPVVYYGPPHADHVIRTTGDVNNRGKLLTKRYRCIKTHPSSASTQPPNQVLGDAPVTTPYWEELAGGELELVPDADTQVLPPGVGAQLVNDPAGQLLDRYVRIGVILFDTDGRVANINYVVRPNSNLGKRINLSNIMGLRTPLRSQFGVVLYDLAAFRANPKCNDQDVMTDLPPVDPTYPQRVLGPAKNQYQQDAAGHSEAEEEQWLDENTTLLMLNRNSGQLVKGE